MKTLVRGAQLKRVSVTIQYKNHPETLVHGYALIHEILSNQVSFFSTQKLPVDEELLVAFLQNGEKKSVTVMVNHMNEQISSGKIMNALPCDSNPFPARKFYRCYTSVVATAAASTAETTAEITAETNETPATATAEMAAEEPKKVVDLFAAEAVPSAPIPDVDELKAA